jgi:hypothetical protein
LPSRQVAVKGDEASNGDHVLQANQKLISFADKLQPYKLNIHKG